MGVSKETEVEAINIARKIALYNSEAVHYVKHSLMLASTSLQKHFADEYEKFTITIRDFAPGTEPSDVLANYTNNKNHDITKFDIENIKELLLEGVRDGD